MARVTPADLDRFVGVGDPQLSPDGERALFSVTRTNEKNARVSQLAEVALSGGEPRQLTSGEKGASGGRYLPDGSGILFVSSREGDRAQMYLLPSSGGEARRITDLPEGSLGEFRISPDGRRVAFTFRETHPDRTKAAAKAREEAGLSEPAWEVDDLWYRLDGDGYFGPQRYRLHTMELPAGEGFAQARLLSEASPHGEYAFDWAPDSRRLAVAHSARKDPFVETPNDQIWIYDSDGSSAMVPGLPAGEKSAVRWSPGGDLLAYAGDVDEADPWGTRNTKLYTVPVAGPQEGGEPQNLFAGTDYDLGATTLSDTKEASFGATFEWAPDGSGLYGQIGWSGATYVARIGVEGGVELLTPGGRFVGMGGLSGGRAAAVLSDGTTVPEIGVVELATGEARALTSYNAGLGIEFVRPEPFVCTAEDGQPVHGWILLPPDLAPGAKAPCAISVHGGPHAMYGDVFFHEFQTLAAAGYAVVISNPRGSKGYGEAFCAAIRGDWGNKDWLDVQAVTRWARSRAEIDPDRVAILGGSYGGYMTNWAIGHAAEAGLPPYRAAITDRCVSNLVSMAGNSDFPFNKDGYFRGVAYGDLEAIRELWRQSPISAFEGVTTPTLVIHSEGDLRCNVEQGEQVFTALRMQGVPTRFVRYPRSTSHGMSRSGPNDLRKHRLGEMLAWFGSHLK